MKGTTQTIVLLLTTSLALGLSGCADGKNEPAPPPTVSDAPVPTTSKAAPTTSAAPIKADPGVAHKGNYSFKTDSSIAPVSFGVNQTWDTLEFKVQMWKTAQCGVLQSEPPAGAGTGPQPQVTFTSPSGKKVGPVPLGTYSSCDVNVNNKVGTPPAPMTADAEQGTWKIDVLGRGVGLQVEIVVAGN